MTLKPYISIEVVDGGSAIHRGPGATKHGDLAMGLHELPYTTNRDEKPTYYRDAKHWRIFLHNNGDKAIEFSFIHVMLEDNQQISWGGREQLRSSGRVVYCLAFPGSGTSARNDLVLRPGERVSWVSEHLESLSSQYADEQFLI